MVDAGFASHKLNTAVLADAVGAEQPSSRGNLILVEHLAPDVEVGHLCL